MKLQIPEIKVDKPTGDFLIKLAHSPIALCIVLAICLNLFSTGVTERMDRIVGLVQEIKAEHDSTPRILADIQSRIQEICAKCRNREEAAPRG